MKSGTPFPIKDLIFFKQGIYNLHESETHEYELLLRCEADWTNVKYLDTK